jgi:hypothetical protein
LQQFAADIGAGQNENNPLALDQFSMLASTGQWSEFQGQYT